MNSNNDHFTYCYNANEGIQIAAALRKVAEAEYMAAEELEALAFGGGPETDLNDMQAHQARNRAALLEAAAGQIDAPVKAAITDDMARALAKSLREF